jgi:class 3 adenylate cyclase/tetratricopeptide (TPR) repeat protein
MENPDDAPSRPRDDHAGAVPRAVEGERKSLTVLFADVVGSTALAERLDPEIWAELMNGAFAFMNEAVARYGGTVGRLMGDGILAFFGAPVAHEDDAERAVRAGLDMEAAAARYREVVRAEHGLDFDVRVGINTGLTVIGTVGDHAKAEYTAMGDSANVAAHLQQEAEPGTVLIGADTYALVRHLADVEARGAVTLKGKAAGVPAYRVRGLRAVPGRARGLAGLASPLVGRERELEQALERLGALEAGRGSVVAIVAEAGLGKSRLVAELRERAPHGDLRWFEGRGLSYAQGVPYALWRQLLLAAIGASDADEAPVVRAALARQFAAVGGADDDVPFLEAVLAVEGDAGRQALEGVSASELAARIALAVRTFLAAIASERPTVLVFDDLHWADPASVDLIARTADVTAEAPLLLVCVQRPERHVPSWALLEALRERGPGLLELRLAPLRGGEASELLANLLHVEGLPDRVRDLILDRSDGNPFFLEEIVRSLIDAGHIVPEGDHWRAADDIADVSIPGTLLGVLGARIDRLPPDTKQVAQTAAVIGRSFAHLVLDRVVGEAPEDERVAELGPHLGLLAREELVRERRRVPELEYAFKHALTQEAAYERLLLRRRRLIHRRVGHVLEHLHGEARDDVAPVLAHHFALGEEWLPAARYALRAAGRALRLYAVRDALDQFEVAFEALDRIKEPPPELVIDAVVGWTSAAVALRRHEDPRERPALFSRIERAVDLARALGDPRRLAQALVAHGNALSLSGFPGTGFRPLLEAHDIARELGDDELVLLPYWAATEILINQDPRGAAAQFAEVVDLARRAGNRGIEAHALGSKAVAHSRLGEFAEARAAIAEALAVAATSGSIIKMADVTIMAGAVHFELGESELGVRYSREGRALAESVAGLECACSGAAVEGAGKLADRDFDAARRDFERSIELGTGTAMEATLLSQVRGQLAATRFWTGEQAAVGELETALANAEAINDEFAIATLAHALAEAHLQLGRYQLAADALARALTSFRERGLRPYLARALATLAAVMDGLGRDAEAAAARAEAAEITALIRAADRPPPTPTVTVHGA